MYIVLSSTRLTGVDGPCACGNFCITQKRATLDTFTIRSLLFGHSCEKFHWTCLDFHPIRARSLDFGSMWVLMDAVPVVREVWVFLPYDWDTIDFLLVATLLDLKDPVETVRWLICVVTYLVMTCTMLLLEELGKCPFVGLGSTCEYLVYIV